jgi:hypothetical protein
MLRRLLCGSAALTIAATVTACGDRIRDTENPYAREIAEAIPKIEAATGMTFRTPPRVEVRTPQQVREFLIAQLDRPEAARELAAEEVVYKRLGMIPETMNLREFLLGVYEEQVAGYYDPAHKTLYVVPRRGAADLTTITIQHELIHALQDQYIDLDSLQKSTDDADRRMAAMAVIEGQATYEQMSAMVGGEENLAARLPGGWDRIRETIRESQAGMPALANAPIVIQETLIFPYLSGAEFVRRFKQRRPGENPLHDMPASTEQVLQTDAYFGEPRDRPLHITLPEPAVGSSEHQSSMGEFGIRLFLYELTRDQNTAFAAAAGWGGDRYMLLRFPQGDALVWVTAWDTALDAAEFGNALSTAVFRRYGSSLAGDVGGRRSMTARNRVVTVTPGTVGGRTVVMYEDVPLGAPTSVVQLPAVTIR